MNKLSMALRFPIAPVSLSTHDQARLVAKWKLVSFENEFQDGERSTRGVPAAYIIFTPMRRFLAMLAPSMAPIEQEGTALFRASFAYCGSYRVSGDTWITRVERNWTDTVAAGEHVREYRLRGDTLEVTTGWRISAEHNERPVRSVFTFRKMK